MDIILITSLNLSYIHIFSFVTRDKSLFATDTGEVKQIGIIATTDENVASLVSFNQSNFVF